MRILQRGFLDLAIFYFCGNHLDERLRLYLPRTTIVAFDDQGMAPVDVARQLGMVRARSLVCIGFSAGMRAVRHAVLIDAFPEHERLGIVAIDGTHASMPAEKWQIEVWCKLAEEARHGEKLFVATCSNNVYTAKLASPFMPTLHVLRAAVEPALFPANPPHEVHTNDLHVYAYASDECDKDAHARQQTEVLPMVLGKHVRPWLDAGSSRRTPLEVAQGYVGWKEDGPNTGAIVRASLSGCVRDGRPLGIREGVAWCAGFVGLCDFEAHAAHTWRAAVRELVHDAVIARTWREVDDYQPQPGDLAVFKRNGSDPRLGSEGHVERVERNDYPTITTIGGNVDNGVIRRTWSVDTDHDLVGWIVRSSALSDEERALVEANTHAATRRFLDATLGA